LQRACGPETPPRPVLAKLLILQHLRIWTFVQIVSKRFKSFQYEIEIAAYTEG
jgi:hypothetical protein